MSCTTFENLLSIIPYLPCNWQDTGVDWQVLYIPQACFFFFLRKCIVIPIQWLNIQPSVLSMQIYLLVLIATKSSNKAMLSRKRWKVVVTFIQNISNEVDDAIVHFEPATPRKHMRFSRHIIYNLPLKPCQINTLFPVSFL